MARPAKQGMDYFPHDTDAASDEKVEALRILYGNDGYAFYFILLERIYRTPDFELDVSDAETRQILARKVEVTPQKFEDMLATALKRGCFDTQAHSERGVLTSGGIRKRAENVVGKRLKMAEAYSKRVSSAETPPEMPQSKVKETKEKESKIPLPSVEDAASAAAPPPVEVEAEELPAESPQPELRTPGGAADVGTRKAKPKVARELLTGDLALLLNPGGIAERVQQMKQPLTQFEADALVTKYGVDAAQQIVKEMANYAKLTTGYVSANLTAQKWLEKRQPAPALVTLPTAQQNNFGRPPQPVGQLQTRATAIAGANAMFDALASGQSPY